MKLETPFVQLPLCFDAERLEAEVAALGEAPWRPHPQGFPGNSMMPLVALNGDPSNEGYKGEMGPTPQLERCEYLKQAIASLGVTVGRTRLMRLAGGAEVTRHADLGYYWADRVRVHIPIVTQSTVIFECGDKSVNMARGECWIFDTWRLHRVTNATNDVRIHLVIDTVGGVEFWSKVRHGHRGGHSPAWAWAPDLIAFEAGARPRLALESVNFPDIMSPWELKQRLDFLVSEASSNGAFGALPKIEDAIERLVLDWRAVWARYGETEPGFPAYSRRLYDFLKEVHLIAAQVRLPNEASLFECVMTHVGQVAIAGQR